MTPEHFAKKPISWWRRENVPERLEVVLSFLESENPANTLEIGSGRGAFALRLQEMGMHVSAVEINREFIRHSRNRDHGKEIGFMQGTAEELPLKNESFDAVICIEVLMHVANPHALLSEISRVLKWDGHAVISFLLKYTADYFKKMIMFLTGYYTARYGKDSFDYRYDTFRDFAGYVQGTNLIVRETHNEEYGNPCLMLQKARK
jgi:ubiquinone/menaquinone biosynthesis C-methylase UbiE